MSGTYESARAGRARVAGPDRPSSTRARWAWAWASPCSRRRGPRRRAAPATRSPRRRASARGVVGASSTWTRSSTCAAAGGSAPAAALLGSALAIKPLLRLDDGHIEPLEKVRTSARALARLEELAVERRGLGAAGRRRRAPPGDAAERADALAERLRERRCPAGRGCRGRRGRRGGRRPRRARHARGRGGAGVSRAASPAERLALLVVGATCWGRSAPRRPGPALRRRPAGQRLGQPGRHQRRRVLGRRWGVAGRRAGRAQGRRPASSRCRVVDRPWAYAVAAATVLGHVTLAVPAGSWRQGRGDVAGRAARAGLVVARRRRRGVRWWSCCTRWVGGASVAAALALLPACLLLPPDARGGRRPVVAAVRLRAGAGRPRSAPHQPGRFAGWRARAGSAPEDGGTTRLPVDGRTAAVGPTVHRARLCGNGCGLARPSVAAWTSTPPLIAPPVPAGRPTTT